MAKIHRISEYLIDATSDCSDNDIKMAVTDQLNMIGQQLYIESADINDWSSQNSLNHENCDLSYCMKYFKNINDTLKYDRPLPESGQQYRHFKVGKIVTVVGIARHTETEELTVVYDHNGTIWNRPLEMFMSKVDREKYPDAKQKYRFELVEE